MSDRTTCITNAGYIRFVKRIIYIGWGCRIVYVMESYTPPDPRCKRFYNNLHCSGGTILFHTSYYDNLEFQIFFDVLKRLE